MESFFGKIYVVSRLYFSATDRNSNGCFDCEVFIDKDAAIKLFHGWRVEELELRKETSCAYDIHQDNDSEFYCSWDGGSEMCIVIIDEKVATSSLDWRPRA